MTTIKQSKKNKTMGDIDKLLQEIAELNVEGDKFSELVDFIQENAEMLSKNDWDKISKIISDAEELAVQLDKLESLNNKWAKSELLDGLHLSNNNLASELLKSNDIQEIPK